MVLVRGKSFTKQHRQEFSWSKKAFDEKEIKEGDRCYFTIKLMTADQFAAMADSNLSMFTKGKKNAETRVTMSSHAQAIEACKNCLLSLERYGVEGGEGAEDYHLAWESKYSNTEKDALLNCMQPDDRAEIRDAVMNYGDLDEEEEKNSESSPDSQ